MSNVNSTYKFIILLNTKKTDTQLEIPSTNTILDVKYQLAYTFKVPVDKISITTFSSSFSNLSDDLVFAPTIQDPIRPVFVRFNTDEI